MFKYKAPYSLCRAGGCLVADNDKPLILEAKRRWSMGSSGVSQLSEVRGWPICMPYLGLGAIDIYLKHFFWDRCCREAVCMCVHVCACVCEKHLLGPSLHAFTSMCMSVQVCTPAQKAYRQHAATLSEVTAPSHVRVALPVPQLVQGGVVVHGCCLSLLG